MFFSCTPIPTKVMDQSSTSLLEKGLGLYLLLMTQQGTSIQPKAWIERRRHTTCCMPRPLTDGQTGHLSQNQSLLSKYKTSMTMHPNLQMDLTSWLCQRCLIWVRRISSHNVVSWLIYGSIPAIVMSCVCRERACISKGPLRDIHSDWHSLMWEIMRIIIGGNLISENWINLLIWPGPILSSVSLSYWNVMEFWDLTFIYSLGSKMPVIMLSGVLTDSGVSVGIVLARYPTDGCCYNVVSKAMF